MTRKFVVDLSFPRRRESRARFRLRFVLPLAFAAVALDAQAQEVPLDAARLVRLVRQDCGACHGMTLQGGLGPALLPAALAGRPQPVLEWVILNGRPGTAMPPWSPLLSAVEAAWIAGRLLEGMPDAR